MTQNRQKFMFCGKNCSHFESIMADQLFSTTLKAQNYVSELFGTKNRHKVYLMKSLAEYLERIFLFSHQNSHQFEFNIDSEHVAKLFSPSDH